MEHTVQYSHCFDAHHVLPQSKHKAHRLLCSTNAKAEGGIYKSTEKRDTDSTRFFFLVSYSRTDSKFLTLMESDL